uniref:ABC transporter domain-containing protein n=1 Tax=Timema douglasi TaxID=61478 RepID=A0A7R8VFF3_TIMDO|nr:unnamed protein product [Timema douglasi]
MKRIAGDREMWLQRPWLLAISPFQFPPLFLYSRGIRTEEATLDIISEGFEPSSSLQPPNPSGYSLVPPINFTPSPGKASDTMSKPVKLQWLLYTNKFSVKGGKKGRHIEQRKGREQRSGLNAEVPVLARLSWNIPGPDFCQVKLATVFSFGVCGSDLACASVSRSCPSQESGCLQRVRVSHLTGRGIGRTWRKLVRVGEPCYGLLGASGCGKTTLLSCIVGRRRLNTGEIHVLGGKPGTKGSGVPGKRVGYMPQEYSSTAYGKSSLIGKFDHVTTPLALLLGVGFPPSLHSSWCPSNYAQSRASEASVKGRYPPPQKSTKIGCLVSSVDMRGCRLVVLRCEFTHTIFEGAFMVDQMFLDLVECVPPFAWSEKINVDNYVVCRLGTS